MYVTTYRPRRCVHVITRSNYMVAWSICARKEATFDTYEEEEEDGNEVRVWKTRSVSMAISEKGLTNGQLCLQYLLLLLESPSWQIETSHRLQRERTAYLPRHV